MITAAQATEYLDSTLGIAVPAFLIEVVILKVATAEAAMTAAGYSAPDKALIQVMAVAIIAAAGNPRRIGSQGAPSGASRSFQNQANALSALRRSLAALDTAGTVTDLIGADPVTGNFFAVVE